MGGKQDKRNRCAGLLLAIVATGALVALAGSLPGDVSAAPTLTSIDLSTYVRVGRFRCRSRPAPRRPTA